MRATAPACARRSAETHRSMRTRRPALRAQIECGVIDALRLKPIAMTDRNLGGEAADGGRDRRHRHARLCGRTSSRVSTSTGRALSSWARWIGRTTRCPAEHEGRDVRGRPCRCPDLIARGSLRRGRRPRAGAHVAERAARRVRGCRPCRHAPARRRSRRCRPVAGPRSACSSRDGTAVGSICSDRTLLASGRGGPRRVTRLRERGARPAVGHERSRSAASIRRRRRRTASSLTTRARALRRRAAGPPRLSVARRTATARTRRPGRRRRAASRSRGRSRRRSTSCERRGRSIRRPARGRGGSRAPC